MKLKLRKMTVEAAKKILQDALNELAGIEREDLTDFEDKLVMRCAEKTDRQGIPQGSNKILNSGS